MVGKGPQRHLEFLGALHGKMSSVNFFKLPRVEGYGG